MSNFFEQELRKLFGDGKIIESPQFVGRACLGTLGGDLRVRAQFITGMVANQYNALKIVVLNRTDGPVDTMVVKLKDLWGTKAVPGYPSGLSPHFWDDGGKVQWYIFRPTDADYQTLRRVAGDYLDVFRERVPERTQPTPTRSSRNSGRKAAIER